jgi:hypothetical protein
MKHDLETKLIFEQIFFLAVFEEKLYKLLDQLNISRISGRISGIRPDIRYPAGYPAGQFGIRPDTGYQKRPDYPAGRISGASLLFNTIDLSFSLRTLHKKLAFKNLIGLCRILCLKN